MRVQIYHDEIDSIACYLTVPDEAGSNFVFAYDNEEHFIYKYDKSEIKLSEDLQKQIVEHCEEVMEMLEELDVKAHELMKEILEEKGLGPVTWSHAALNGE